MEEFELTDDDMHAIEIAKNVRMPLSQASKYCANPHNWYWQCSRMPSNDYQK